MKKNFKNIARVLRESRVAAGKSQLALSKVLDLTSSQFISNIEREKAPLSPRLFKTTARFLKIDPEVLISAHLKDEEEYLKKLVDKSSR